MSGLLSFEVALIVMFDCRVRQSGQSVPAVIFRVSLILGLILGLILVMTVCRSVLSSYYMGD